MPKENRRNRLNPASPDRRTVVQGCMAGRAWWPCACAWLRPLQHSRAAPVQGCVSLGVFPLALPGLRLTCILPLIPPESFLFSSKPEKAQISHNMSIIKSKEANLSHSHIDLAYK